MKQLASFLQVQLSGSVEKRDNDPLPGMLGALSGAGKNGEEVKKLRKKSNPKLSHSRHVGSKLAHLFASS